MKNYTGYQWLLIDAATQFGLDKLTFEERIQWAESCDEHLESLDDLADEPYLYTSAVMAIRKAQKGLPSGHMVAVDGVCSGAQIMSTLTGCLVGADATGLIDPDRRADAYTQLTDTMNNILGGKVNVSRKDAKKALMTVLYGSKRTPKTIFGEDTPEYKAFYQALTEVVPGAWELLQVLLGSWNPGALVHQWKLPDGYDAVVRVMVKKSARIEVDELNHASFTYEFYENEGTDKGLSNAANVVHSVDAFVLREMHRRCNYGKEMVEGAVSLIQEELNRRAIGLFMPIPDSPKKLQYLQDQFARSGMVSVVVLPFLDKDNVSCLSQQHLEGLLRVGTQMLGHKSFPLVTIHDAFAAHANNVNQVRFHYKEILADMADSRLLDDLLTQLYKEPATFNKLSPNLGNKIRNSNYALC